MHKRLLILGLLLRGPLTGYDLHRIVRAHGELYGDLKKANLYYLLERMAKEGLVEMTVLPGGRGPRRERLQYRLSAAGRTEMRQLLRAVLQTYEPAHSGLEVAIVLVDQLPAAEAHELLEARLVAVRATRKKSAAELGLDGAQPGSAGDHLLSLVETELAWLRRALRRMREAGSTDEANALAEASRHSERT